MWTCPTCCESLQDQFKSCWNCVGGEAAPAEPASEEPPKTVSVYGHRIPWAILSALALLVLLLIDSMMEARGNFSRLPMMDKVWFGLLFVTGVGISTRSERILRLAVVLLVLGGVAKVVLLFGVTASKEFVEPFDLVRGVVQPILLCGSAAILWIHIVRTRK